MVTLSIPDVSDDIENTQKSIKFYRERRGWSRAELGSRVGVTAVMISKLETGGSHGSVALLYRISKVLGMGVDALMRGIPEEDTPWVLM
ncbi:helix-turn-helix domain-containing protein [Glycomyces arizonensis]|uniref:helix-turn-helix domain-containing protein n=1 Tax=Glycomyces arizonensis TaxID=256035 RepID=UPI000A04A696|nr:helix-turn-helix transcriptional regulator [Glycomyces arizonensis]